MTKVILEGKIETDSVSIEDGGCAVIVEPDWNIQGGDDNIFVRIQSWDENLSAHPEFDSDTSREERIKYGHQTIRKLFGKKVRVTIEVIDDE